MFDVNENEKLSRKIWQFENEQGWVSSLEELRRFYAGFYTFVKPFNTITAFHWEKRPGSFSFFKKLKANFTKNEARSVSLKHESCLFTN